MANVMKSIVLMVAGLIILAMGSVILTGEIVSDYYDNVHALEWFNETAGTRSNVSALYLLFLEFLPFAIVLGIFAVLIGAGLLELGVLSKLGI